MGNAMGLCMDSKHFQCIESTEECKTMKLLNKG
jgi:hypothetical protein